MTSFSGLKYIAQEAADSLTRGAGGVGNFISKGSGIEKVGREFGTTFGSDFGKNIPTSYSVNGNIDVSGRIDVSANVNVDVNVDVTVDLQLEKLVAASRIIADGLRDFDIFGGLSKQITNERASNAKVQNVLSESAGILRSGYGFRRGTQYFAEVVVINDSAEYVSGEKGTGYVASELAAGLVTIVLNSGEEDEQEVLDSEFSIQSNNVGRPSVSTPRTVNSYRLRRLRLDGINAIKLSLRPVRTMLQANEAENALKNCKVQVRVIRETEFWQHTVAEYVADGATGPLEVIFQLPINSDIWSPIPGNSESITQIREQIQLFRDSLRYGTFAQTPVGEFSGSADLFNKAILASFTDRISRIREISDSLSALQRKTLDESPYALDVRDPLVLCISIGKFSDFRDEAPFSVKCKVSGSQFDETIEFVDARVSGSDELAISIPVRRLNRNEPVVIDVETEVSMTGAVQLTDKPYATISVVSGYEWDLELLHSKTVIVPVNGTGVSANFELQIADVAAT